MKKKALAFDAEEFVGAVESVRDSLAGKTKTTLRTTRLRLPPPAPELSPADVAEIRQRLNVSQPVFAQMLNVPKVTAISWEKGRRKPSGAALRLLQLVRKNPKILQAA